MLDTKDFKSEIEALGGDQEDLALLENVNSDDEMITDGVSVDKVCNSVLVLVTHIP
jgi:hypothetical protein